MSRGPPGYVLETGLDPSETVPFSVVQKSPSALVASSLSMPPLELGLHEGAGKDAAVGVEGDWVEDCELGPLDVMEPKSPRPCSSLLHAASIADASLLRGSFPRVGSGP